VATVDAKGAEMLIKAIEAYKALLGDDDESTDTTK
jgi:hypothetical protein